MAILHLFEVHLDHELNVLDGSSLGAVVRLRVAAFGPVQGLKRAECGAHWRTYEHVGFLPTPHLPCLLALAGLGEVPWKPVIGI